MSQEHLWSALGRSRVDLEFSRRLLFDPLRALHDAGYDLAPSELDTLRQIVTAPPPPFSPSGIPAPAPADIEFQHKKMQERMSAQIDRATELGKYTVDILRRTLDHARSAYRTITWMNGAMFITGIGLFLFAAIYGAVSKDTSYTLVLAGLGAANFIALFMLGPIERTQTALSNLVQVEIAFMNYFEQITFWETYALAPDPMTGAPNHNRINEASEQLQRRSQETILLLQAYVENTGSSRPVVASPKDAVSEPA